MSPDAFLWRDAMVASQATCPSEEGVRMTESMTATVERIDGREAGPGTQPAMLTVHEVAGMLSCSARTVYRLCDSGRMPRPVKLGSLVRWPREVVEQWIANGCPDQRKGGRL
jgi:excisionase family DNA binding protein